MDIILVSKSKKLFTLLAMWIPHEDTNRCTRVKFLFKVNIGRVTFTFKDL